VLSALAPSADSFPREDKLSFEPADLFLDIAKPMLGTDDTLFMSPPSGLDSDLECTLSLVKGLRELMLRESVDVRTSCF